MKKYFQLFRFWKSKSAYVDLATLVGSHHLPNHSYFTGSGRIKIGESALMPSELEMMDRDGCGAAADLRTQTEHFYVYRVLFRLTVTYAAAFCFVEHMFSLKPV